MLKVLQKSLKSVSKNWKYLGARCNRYCTHRPVELRYSEDKSNKILEALNNKSIDELARYNLSQSRAQKIGDWKLKNGPFKSVEEILKLDGFGVKVTEKFCQSLLCNKPSSKAKTGKLRFGQFTTPIVPASFALNCNSCVSLHIGVSSVTWTRLEVNRTSPCVLTHWQHHDILDKKMHVNDLVQKCLYLDKIIPAADCYILETPQTAQPASPGNAQQININMQKAQLIAILSFALCNRADPIREGTYSGPNSNLFYLKRFLVSRLFRTLVGTERVSSEHAVTELLRTHYNLEDVHNEMPKEKKLSPYAGEVIVPPDLREIYKSSEGYHRDFLGQSFLIGLTFIRLCLLKCPKSLTVILGNSNLLQD